MASPNLSEIITTTLRNRSGKVADAVSKGNALLNKLREKGAWKPATGRTIVQEVEYAEGNWQWYSGYEEISVSPPDVITSFEYNWKQGASSVSASGLEIEVQNTGREQVIDLLETRIKNAERTMRNNVTVGCYATGTGNGGKEIGGLQLLVADTPTSGIVGGVDRQTWAFAKNKTYDASTDGGTAATSANIQSYMNRLYIQLTRGPDKPDLILADSVYYRLFWDSLQAIQRITTSDKGSAGYRSLEYAGSDVVYEDSSGIPASHMYFLNTDFLYLRYSPKRNFTPLDKVQSMNQDAIVQLMTWAGNLTCSNFLLQGVLKA
jgi:hypothetical protein